MATVRGTEVPVAYFMGCQSSALCLLRIKLIESMMNSLSLVSVSFPKFTACGLQN